MFVARQRLGKKVSAAIDIDATIEEPVSNNGTVNTAIRVLLETVFSVWSVQSGYKEEFS
jgi:hypothetical protein